MFTALVHERGRTVNETRAISAEFACVSAGVDGEAVGKFCMCARNMLAESQWGGVPSHTSHANRLGVEGFEGVR